MHLDGVTYQEIADAAGISRQAVHQTITGLLNTLAHHKRGRDFYYSNIKYKGIYEYFANNQNATFTSFVKAVAENNSSKKAPTIKNFLTGKHDSRFTIDQIKRMCKVCGKSFEEVFEERGDM
jgi:predicted DNA-binding protein YlxM (UPF0122 family)